MCLLTPVASLGQVGGAAKAAGSASAKSSFTKAADETQAASAAILGTVSQIRNLSVKRAVPSGLKSRAEIAAMLSAELKEAATDLEYSDSSTLLRFLGLAPADFDLRREYSALLTRQVAGFYAPKARRFFLADWIPVAEQRAVIAHELTHALADQHFDLRKITNRVGKNSDERLAIQSLIEGDATAVMLQFSLQERGIQTDLASIEPSLSDILREPPADDDLAKTPEILRETLLFPYQYGAGFVQRLLRAGSWSRVNACYSAPPVSTEQVLHPDKYFADESPKAVVLPDLSGVLGSGWRKADEDTSGEFGITLLLGRFVGRNEAVRAAAGWGGDRFAFYVSDSESRCTYVQLSTWDSEEDALEMYDAYSRRVAARYGTSGVISDAITTWSTEAGLVHVERRGTSVLVVEGFHGASIDSVVSKAWKSAS